MKIYFCGSIRGGRQDAMLYSQIIDKLRTFGDVLTEHIGDETQIAQEKEDEWIWNRDCQWLRSSDIVVAECTQASLGVGYELAYAQSLGKPVHVLFRKDPKELSAMISGDPFYCIHYYSDISELSHVFDAVFSTLCMHADEKLLASARKAMRASYSPYSRHAVGAALLCENGQVFLGCNVENASYGLTNCAERSAVFNAISSGNINFSTLAIAAEKEPPWPCGACRQVLNEFAPQLRIIVTWGTQQVAEASLNDLLPHSFGPNELNADYIIKNHT